MSGRHSMGLVVQGEQAAWEFDDPTDVFHIYISNETLGRAAAAEGWSDQRIELQPTLCMDDPLVQQLALALTHACSRGERDRLYAETLGMAMSMRLLRSHAVGGRPAACIGGLAGWQLRRVSDYLMGHLAEDVALAELAAIAGLSPHHFCRAFRQSTGLPPHAWLVARRMERAQEMMIAHPNMGLIEIALAVGYQSQAAFGAAFRRATGVSPGQWRRGRAE